MKEKDNKVINFYEKTRIPYIDDPKTGHPRPLTKEEAQVILPILRKFLQNVEYEGRGFNEEEKKWMNEQLSKMESLRHLAIGVHKKFTEELEEFE